MEARPISISRPGAKQLTNMGVSGALSSPLPVLPTHFEEAYPKLPDSQQVSMERELMTSPLTHASRLSSNSGVMGHIFSSSSGLSSDLHYSSVSYDKSQSRNTPFISQSSTNGESFTVSQSSHSTLLQSTTSSHYAKENSASWCSDSVSDFLDFPVNTPVENTQVESSRCSGIMVPEEFGKRNDWQEWADQLITDDDALNSNWDDLLADTNVTDIEPKVGSFICGCLICFHEVPIKEKYACAKCGILWYDYQQNILASNFVASDGIPSIKFIIKYSGSTVSSSSAAVYSIWRNSGCCYSRLFSK